MKSLLRAERRSTAPGRKQLPSKSSLGFQTADSEAGRFAVHRMLVFAIVCAILSPRAVFALRAIESRYVLVEVLGRRAKVTFEDLRVCG